MARVKRDAVANAEVDRVLEEMLEPANAARPLPASPVGLHPKLGGGFDRVLLSVIDESIDVEQEHLQLEGELRIEEALTPEVVRAAINRCEKNASNAHRLYALAKVHVERFRFETEISLSAMRDQAVFELTEEKNAGKRTKQVTDADVLARIASTHADEWREISDGLARAEAMLKVLERFSDVWYRRSWSLSSLNG